MEEEIVESVALALQQLVDMFSPCQLESILHCSKKTLRLSETILKPANEHWRTP